MVRCDNCGGDHVARDCEQVSEPADQEAQLRLTGGPRRLLRAIRAACDSNHSWLAWQELERLSAEEPALATLLSRWGFDTANAHEGAVMDKGQVTQLVDLCELGMDGGGEAWAREACPWARALEKVEVVPLRTLLDCEAAKDAPVVETLWEHLRETIFCQPQGITAAHVAAACAGPDMSACAYPVLWWRFVRALGASRCTELEAALLDCADCKKRPVVVRNPNVAARLVREGQLCVLDYGEHGGRYFSVVPKEDHEEVTAARAEQVQEYCSAVKIQTACRRWRKAKTGRNGGETKKLVEGAAPLQASLTDLVVVHPRCQAPARHVGHQGQSFEAQELVEFLRGRAAALSLATAAREAAPAACSSVAGARQHLDREQAAVRRQPGDVHQQAARDSVARKLREVVKSAEEEVGCQTSELEEMAEKLRAILANVRAGAQAYAEEGPAPPPSLGLAGSLLDELCALALTKVDDWRAAGEEAEARAGSVLRGAFRLVAMAARGKASNREGLEEMGRALSEAGAAVEAERRLQVERPLPPFPRGPLLAAGAALLADMDASLAVLRAAHEGLRQQLEDVEVILKPEAVRDPAVCAARQAAARGRRARFDVEAAELQRRFAREEGLPTEDAEAQLARARAAKQTADREAAEASAALLRLLPTFPEIAAEFREGLPPELIPIWRPQRTLRDFGQYETLESSNPNHLVYRVSDDSGAYALKRFNVSSASLRTCWHEAAVLHRARHPHIVELVAAFEDEGMQSFFLQFPFYEHGSVDRWCAQDTPDELARLRVLHEVLQALAHLHALRITHADVKPANILIGADGRARLADFDISIDSATRTCRGAACTRSATRVGYTPGYIAPELFQSGASPATDMYAFGATAKLVLPTRDGDAGSFVEQCQQQDPTQRLTAAAAMRHPVFQPLFRWRRETTHRCCVMASELCGHGTKDVKLEDGVLCGGTQRHFTCNECLSQHVMAAARQDLGTKRERQGQIFCPRYPTECRCSPYSDPCIARAVSEEAFGAYTKARLELLEQEKAMQLEAEMQDRVDAEVQRLLSLTQREREVRDAVRHIQEEILTLKCPNCAQAFMDFAGCFALECSRCRQHFCGWCVSACAGNQAAHDHVRGCVAKPPGADVFFGTEEQFRQAMARRRRGLLGSYLAGLDAEVRQQVVHGMQQDLQGLLP